MQNDHTSPDSTPLSGTTTQAVTRRDFHTPPLDVNSRLAFTVNETAQVLGLSPISVYRLIQRGKLKASGDLRTKLISKKAIEEFLR